MILARHVASVAANLRTWMVAIATLVMTGEAMGQECRTLADSYVTAAQKGHEVVAVLSGEEMARFKEGLVHSRPPRPHDEIAIIRVTPPGHILLFLQGDCAVDVSFVPSPRVIDQGLVRAWGQES